MWNCPTTTEQITVHYLRNNAKTLGIISIIYYFESVLLTDAILTCANNATKYKTITKILNNKY